MRFDFWISSWEAGGQGRLPSRPNCKGPLGPPCAVTPRRTWPPGSVSPKIQPLRISRGQSTI